MAHQHSTAAATALAIEKTGDTKFFSRSREFVLGLTQVKILFSVSNLEAKITISAILKV